MTSFYTAFAFAVLTLTALRAQPTESILYTFSESAPKGTTPNGALVGDGAGNLYGTTFNGGQSNQGTIFKVDSKGRETVLYSFTGGADGGLPSAGLAIDAQANLYGTAPAGGVAYKLGSTGTETILYSFTGAVGGSDPLASLTPGANGVLYGTASSGGLSNFGVVFEIKSASDAYPAPTR